MNTRSGLNNSNIGSFYSSNNNMSYNDDVNPFNKFNGQSTMDNYSANKFNNAFSPGRTILDKVDTTNRKTIVHNNVNDNVMSERVVEYTINIDSADRDICTFPNPYSFTVKFNANSAVTENTKTYEHGKLVYDKQYFRGTPYPIINKEFRNVKYVKLEAALLPQFGNIKLKKDCYVYDCDNKLIDDRYIILNIDEFDDTQNKTYNTSDSSDRNAPNPFAQIYPDTKYGKYFYYGGIIGGIRTYKNENLGNISKLTIKLYDSCGTALNIEELLCGPCCNDLRHPLNKNHQIFLSFTFGVIESQIATMVKFER